MNAPSKVTTNTALATRTPFGVFGSLQREIDRLFDDFSPFAPAFTQGRSFGDMKCKMDLAETRNGLELTVELPGLEEKDVQIAVDDGVLTVSGEKTFESEDKDKTYHFVERGYGSFSRSIALPAGAKADQIKATMTKGVLKVFIPGQARSEPKKIAIQKP